MEKNGKRYKKRLKDNIDALIPAVQSYGELLIKMQELGYEIMTGKYDSFRLNSQERFTRSKTLGEEYKDTYQEYVRSGKSTDFRESHRAAIILYESAQDILKAKYPGRKSIALSTLNKELSDLEAKKIDLSARLSEIDEEKSDLQTVK